MFFQLLMHYFLAVLSFVELVESVFKIPDVKVFPSNKISQVPLENLFDRQRQRGRVNENPSVSEFLKNMLALRVVNNTSSRVTGNC